MKSKAGSRYGRSAAAATKVHRNLPGHGRRATAKAGLDRTIRLVQGAVEHEDRQRDHCRDKQPHPGLGQDVTARVKRDAEDDGERQQQRNAEVGSPHLVGCRAGCQGLAINLGDVVQRGPQHREPRPTQLSSAPALWPAGRVPTKRSGH